MVDDDHENTPRQVTSKCKPYLHYQMPVISIAVMKFLPQKCMITIKGNI